jgi:6-phosphogluconolactonase
MRPVVGGLKMRCGEMNNHLKIFDSEIKMNRKAIDIIRSELKKKEKISIGFSGGKTPISFFKLLALEKELPWDRINIFLVDERWDKSGNDTLKKLITTYLLDKIKIPSENLNLIDYYDSIGITREKYAEKVFQNLKKMGDFDILFLGIGSDGHTASIFEVEECQLKGDVIINSSPRHPHIRISLGMRVINGAKRKIFLLGPEKQKLLEDRIDDKYPVSRVSNPEFLSFK